MRSTLIAVFCLCSFGKFVAKVDGATVSSCPSYGCRPSGTFSYLINLSSQKPKVIWNTTYESIEKCLGCVGNINNIVCPYKGPKSDGYVAIDGTTGKQSWYASVLHDPSLPVMDIEGDIIGTDGHSLVKYEADGTQVKPTKPVSPFLYPLYSAQLAENGILLFASMSGVIFTMDTAGIPHASISLNGTVERSNGTFIPITTPIIVGTRAYVLTEFKPDEDTETRQPNILGMQRLYAIDIFLRMVDRLHITWYFNFEREISDDNTLRFKPKQDVQGNPLILANVQENIIHIILPQPEGSSNSLRMFWAIKDGGDTGDMLYKRAISASKMAMYEINGLYSNKIQKFGIKKFNRDLKLFSSIKMKRKNYHQTQKTSIWLLAENKNFIYRVNSTNGSIEATFNLTSLLDGKAEVTSDIIVSRSDDKLMDNIIFGATISKPTIQNYLISIDYNGDVQWMVPTPSNVFVVGQIAGISSEGVNSDDMIVAFGNKNDMASVFAVQ